MYPELKVDESELIEPTEEKFIERAERKKEILIQADILRQELLNEETRDLIKCQEKVPNPANKVVDEP